MSSKLIIRLKAGIVTFVSVCLMGLVCMWAGGVTFGTPAAGTCVFLTFIIGAWISGLVMVLWD